MRCPHCLSDSLVLETRAASHLTVSRRRKCTYCGERFTTIEVHQPVFCSAKQRAVKYEQTVAKRARIYARDVELARRLHEGADVLAREFGITKSAVFLAAKRGRARQAKAGSPPGEAA